MSNIPPNRDPFQGQSREAPFEGDLRQQRPVPRQPYPSKVELPYATAVLVLGIASIPVAFFYGIFGIALAVVSLALAASSMRLYATSPQKFSQSSYSYLKTGRICAIVGLIVSALVILAMVVVYGLFFSFFVTQAIY